MCNDPILYFCILLPYFGNVNEQGITLTRNSMLIFEYLLLIQANQLKDLAIQTPLLPFSLLPFRFEP